VEASLANGAKLSNMEDLDRAEVVVVTPVEVNDKVVPAANTGTERLSGAQGEVKRLREKRIEDKHQILVKAQVENVKERAKPPDSTRGQIEANSQIKHGGRETKKIIKEDLLDEDEEKKIKNLLKGDFSGKERVKDLLEEESIVNIVDEGRKERIKDLLEEESIINIVDEGRRERAKGRETGCGENFSGKLKNHTEVTGKNVKAEDGILENVEDIQNNMKKNKKKTTENPKEDDENKKKTTDNPKEDNGNKKKSADNPKEDNGKKKKTADNTKEDDRNKKKTEDNPKEDDGNKKKTADNPKEDDEKEKTKDEHKNMYQDPVKEVKITFMPGEQ
jgi:hypothetical protein